MLFINDRLDDDEVSQSREIIFLSFARLSTRAHITMMTMKSVAYRRVHAYA
jgi:hypothetical protein